RAAAGFDADDPVGRKYPAAGKEFRIFACVNVIRDYSKLVRRFEARAQCFDESSLARTDGTANADLERLGNHDRKSLASRKACRMLAISNAGAKDHMSPSVLSCASSASLAMSGPTLHRMRWRASCPSGRSRSDAPTRAALVE